MANSYRTSTGEKVFKSEVDKKVLETKRKKVEGMMDEHNYIFCEDCGRNSSSGEPIDCSHDIGVKDAQESGRTELAWDVENITMRCRPCHRVWDKSGIKSGKL